MKRTDANRILVEELGIENPSNAQVSSFLNAVNTEKAQGIEDFEKTSESKYAEKYKDYDDLKAKNAELLKANEDLKSNKISKEEYDKLVEENGKFKTEAKQKELNDIFLGAGANKDALEFLATKITGKDNDEIKVNAEKYLSEHPLYKGDATVHKIDSNPSLKNQHQEPVKDYNMLNAVTNALKEAK